MEVRTIPPEDVDRILGAEEGHFIDLKAREIAPAKLSQSVSAFANTAGGEIFIGVAEQRTPDGKYTAWRGFPDQEAANAIIAVLEGMGAPRLTDINFISSDGQEGYLLHLLVQKSRQIVLATDGRAYVRRGAQKLPVTTPEMQRRLELDKGVASFEDENVRAEISLVTNSITSLQFMIEQVPSLEPDVWLKSQQVLTDNGPTVAGALLFSDEPQALLPKRSAIKVLRYRTVESDLDRDALAFHPLTIEGPVVDMISKAVSTTKNILEGIKRLGEGGLEDVVYPDETLHEIITNAVLHRDYSVATDIQIRIYDDRVEVHSPGLLPGHVTKENILDEQLARNPKMVRLVNKFPDAPNKDMGEGMNTAFAAMRKIRLQDPEVTEQGQSVVVFIRHTRLSSPAQIVMEYLQRNMEITNAIGREITGLRRDVQMKDLFVAMRKQELIEQVPEKKGRASAWRLASAPENNEPDPESAMPTQNG